MTLRLYSRIKFGLALGTGALLAVTLCVQSIRTYLYVDGFLVPQQAQREAERQAAGLSAAARSAGITDPHSLGAVLEHALESAPDRVLWMRVRDPDKSAIAQAGSPGTAADLKAFVATVPLRMRPSRTAGHRPAPYTIQLAISLKAVSASFDGLRHNVLIGLSASIALLIAIAVIALRTKQYLRGKHLEGELQLARRVQRDLQPKPHSVSAEVTFAASAVAADQVGGDFYDIFEAAPGKTAIVLGDVSGKGVSAALLVSVLQGAIRSSTTCDHEFACERINRMLCELTARERFASLFWGVFDSASGTLRYVNAGHAAPMLARRAEGHVDRLDEGGPVLGVLPSARYSAGTVEIGAGDTLVLYSDGINEAANASEEEFGEGRIEDLIVRSAEAQPEELCHRIMGQSAAFASAGPPPDDRTLMVVRFQGSADVQWSDLSEGLPVEAAA